MKLVAFRTMLEAELGETSTRVRALLLQWTNNVYHEITRARPWSWLEATVSSYSHAAAAASFALVKTGSPAWAAKRILDLVDATDAPETALEFVGECQFWGQRYDSTLTGNPLRYRVWAGNVYLHPIPDSIRTLRFRYRQVVGDLNTTDNAGLGTEILVPEEDIGVLYEGVLAAAHRWLRDPIAVQVHQAEFERKLARMSAADDQGPGQYAPRPRATEGDWPNPTNCRLVIPT